MKTLPDALAELMRDRKMSQTDLWAAADVSPTAVSRYLSGERGRRINSQAAETIAKIAGALGVAPDYFLEWRGWRVQEIAREHLDLVDEVYDLLVAHAASADSRRLSKGT